MLKNYLLRILMLGAPLQAAQLCCVKLVTLHLSTTISGLFSKPFLSLLPLLLVAVAGAVLVYWAGIHFLEKRRMHELPLDSAAKNLVFGLAAGFMLCAALFTALWVDGSVTYVAYNGLDRVPAAALIFAAGVVFEELIFRGVVLRVGEETLGTAPALIISAALFAASHLGNNGVTVIGVVALFAGGIVLGLAYVLSRNLWLAIGAHFGWNFTLGAIFGVSVSGHEAHGVFVFKVSGPDWLGGGRFGPESSIFNMVFLVLLTIALWWYAARHGEWRAHQIRHFWRAADP